MTENVLIRRFAAVLLGIFGACAPLLAQTQTLFTTQKPVQIHQSDGVGYELGAKFTADTPGQITAIRFWKDSRELGTHTGRVWSASGAVLATTTFAKETASGWQVQKLATPLNISANTIYLVTVNTGRNYYVATTSGFAAAINSGNLHSVVGSNGVYGALGRLPTNTYMSSNYFRDVVFVRSSSGSTPSVAITVSPTTASIKTGGTAQFSASVTGTTNTGVTWSVVSGGGTITSSGLYTAPASAATATIKASSVADTTKSASATITVSAPVSVGVTVSPSSASIATGATQQFTASVSGTTNTGVTWSVVSGGGTITSSGLYTAPASAATATIKATSVADTSKSASATITVSASGSTTASYGNTGDPYNGGSPDGSALLVSGCQTLSANASYRLTQNVGSNAAATCFTLSGPKTKLDLGGYAVTGRISGNISDLSGITIFNGKVTCNYADAGEQGCIYLNSSGSASATLSLHHLTIAQTSTTSSGAARGVHIDWTPASNSLAYAIRVYNVTSTVGNATGPRTPNLNIQGGNLTVEYAFNDISCPAGANACQGQVCYGVRSCMMHDNRLTMADNIVPDGETGRALLFDSTSGGAAWNNLVYTNNNRAVRIRDSVGIRIYNNSFKHIDGSAANYAGAIHLGDPDSGSNNLQAEIDHNTFEMVGGNAVWARNAYNVTVHDNTVSGTSGTWGLLRSPLSGGTTNIMFNNNPSVITLGTPESMVESGAQASFCNSGSASGSGAVSYTSGC